MRTLMEFTKTTFLGGFLIILLFTFRYFCLPKQSVQS